MHKFPFHQNSFIRQIILIFRNDNDGGESDKEDICDSGINVCSSQIGKSINYCNKDICVSLIAGKWCQR